MAVLKVETDIIAKIAKSPIRRAVILVIMSVGVLSYSTKVTVHFQLKDYSTKAEVFDAINNIPYMFGSTNTAEAITTMRQEMFTIGNGVNCSIFS
jgi:hypothetical protein